MKIVVTYTPDSLVLSMGIPAVEVGNKQVFQFEDKKYDDWCKQDDGVILEDLFERFNMYPWEDDIAQHYRNSPVPSLSVGMIVELDGRAYLCTSHGWHRV